MTERNPPVWMQSGTYNAVDDRMVTSLLTDRTVNVAGTSYSIEGGVVPPLNQLQVTANSTMNVSISPGMIIIRASGTNPSGAYLCYNDGARTVTLDIEGSGNPRIDMIYAEAEDLAAGGTTSVWRIAVKKGNPSASPVAQALSASQYPLASVRVVPASQNGGANKILPTQVTDLRTFATGNGGMHLKWAGGLNPAHSPGRMLYDIPNQKFYVSNGAAWDQQMNYSSFLTEQKNTYIPVHRSEAGGLHNQTHAETTWRPYLYETGASNSPAGPQNAVTANSRTGLFLVTIQAQGRINPLIDKDDVNGSTLVMSVQAKAGSTVVMSPNTSWASLQIRIPYWQTVSHTFLANLTSYANQGITFNTMWYFNRPNGKTLAIEVSRQYLLVVPVL